MRNTDAYNDDLKRQTVALGPASIVLNSQVDQLRFC